MQIAPSTYYARKKRGVVSAAALAEAYAAHEVFRQFTKNRSVYGVRKMHHQMWRAGHPMGRDQVGRLMGICADLRSGPGFSPHRHHPSR
jgi:putative transposase